MGKPGRIKALNNEPPKTLARAVAASQLQFGKNRSIPLAQRKEESLISIRQTRLTVAETLLGA